MCAAEKRH